MLSANSAECCFIFCIPLLDDVVTKEAWTGNSAAPFSSLFLPLDGSENRMEVFAVFQGDNCTNMLLSQMSLPGQLMERVTLSKGLSGGKENFILEINVELDVVIAQRIAGWERKRAILRDLVRMRSDGTSWNSEFLKSSY
jgi:hypothetical protein